MACQTLRGKGPLAPVSALPLHPCGCVFLCGNIQEDAAAVSQISDTACLFTPNVGKPQSVGMLNAVEPHLCFCFQNASPNVNGALGLRRDRGVIPSEIHQCIKPKYH